jgi:hypothetical protein
LFTDNLKENNKKFKKVEFNFRQHLKEILGDLNAMIDGFNIIHHSVFNFIMVDHATHT